MAFLLYSMSIFKSNDANLVFIALNIVWWQVCSSSLFSADLSVQITDAVTTENR